MLYEKNKYGYKLTEESKEQSVKIQIEKSIGYDDLENILITALEGAIEWGGIDNSLPEWEEQPKDMPLSQYSLQILLDGKAIKFFDNEEEDDTNWILTLEKLLNGIKLNYKKRPFDCDIDNMDAITVDCIIQYALFNELIFG